MKQTKKTYKIDKKALAEIESLGGAFAKKSNKRLERGEGRILRTKIRCPNKT